MIFAGKYSSCKLQIVITIVIGPVLLTKSAQNKIVWVETLVRVYKLLRNISLHIFKCRPV